MAISEIIEQMKSLACHCSSMIDEDDPDDIWKDDVEALNEAVEKLGNEHQGKNAAEIITTIMKKEGVNSTTLAERMGCARQNVSQMLTRGTVNMRYDSFCKLVEALEYEIIVRKK